MPADVRLRQGRRAEQHAGEAKLLSRRMCNQGGKVLVVARDDDPPLATRPIEYRRIIRPREADVSDVHNVDATGLKLFHRRDVDVLIE